MKSMIKSITLCALLGVATCASADTTNLFPNGNFSVAGPTADWVEVNCCGNFSYTYPATGGNPGGYATMNNAGPLDYFGIWVNGDTTPLPIASSGLTAGLTYTFVQDMKIISGANVGGFKIDWFDGANAGAGSTGDLRPSTNGHNTANWETYSFSATIPAAAVGMKIVPLWGQLSEVAFDNIGVVIPTIPPPVVINYPTNNAPTPPARAPSAVRSMYNSSGTYTDHAGIGWYAGWSGNAGGNGDYGITNPPSSTVTSTVKKYLGLNYAGVEFYNPNQIDTTGMNTLHVDIWTPNANQFGIQLVSLAGGTQAGQVNFLPAGGVITSNSWISLNIPLSQFTTANPNLILTNLEQLLWIDNMGGGVQNGNFYIDNVYFYSNAVVQPPVANYPTNAAPTPTHLAANVVSLYNSASNYTTVPIDTWLTGWSSAAYSDYTITNAGNRVVKRYSALNFAGVEFFNPKINASGMSTFHIDLWTPNADKFSVKLVSFNPGGQEYEVVFTNNVIVSNNWVSLDIPISTFTTGQPAMDFSQLGQLLFINNNPGGPQFGTFFIDNVYFYTVPVATQPTILSPAAGGGNFTAQSASQLGFNYVLQGTPVLAPATWTNLQTNAGTGGTLNFSVPIAPGSPQRFFRINVQ